VSVRRLHSIQPETGFAFNAENLAWAKQTIAKYPAGKQASAVIPLLWRAQEQNENWVSKPVIEYVADMLGMSYIRVLEVATFYTMFQLQPVGKKAHIQVCGTTPCMLRGAEDLKKVCQNKIHHEPQHLSDDGNLSWEEVECLGACVNAPMVQVFKDTYEDLTPASLEKLIDDLAAGRKVKVGPQIDRHHAAPEGGALTLTDPALYKGQRNFTRVEPPPPAEAAPAAAAAPAVVVPAGTPAPASVAPKPEDIRPVTPAAVAASAQKAEAIKKEEASSAPGMVTTEKAQAETGIVRVTKDEVVKSTTPTPLSGKKPVEITNPKAPEPIKLAEQKVQPARVASPDGKPELLKKARGGKGDDLKLIWGVGPKLEQMLNTMGVWHFDQIASWSAKELAWVDERLEGFKGRAKRDEWVKQSKKLSSGWRPDNAVGEKPKKK
jgi:NADH-quinone oxidoreductase subunit E